MTERRFNHPRLAILFAMTLCAGVVVALALSVYFRVSALEDSQRQADADAAAALSAVEALNQQVESLGGDPVVTPDDLPQPGEPGPPGEQGPVGAIGAMGPVGPTGPQGETGKRGPRGFTGLDGSAGVAGPRGPVGAQGPAGPAGTDGKDGAQGPAGPQGDVGPAGPAGSAAPGSYSCPEGQYVVGLTVSAGGDVSLSCATPALLR